MTDRGLCPFHDHIEHSCYIGVLADLSPQLKEYVEEYYCREHHHQCARHILRSTGLNGYVTPYLNAWDRHQAEKLIALYIHHDPNARRDA